MKTMVDVGVISNRKIFVCRYPFYLIVIIAFTVVRSSQNRTKREVKQEW